MTLKDINKDSPMATVKGIVEGGIYA